MLGISLLIIPFVDLYFHVYFNMIPYFFVERLLIIFNIQFFSLVQKETDSEYIGRVYSVIFTIAVLFMPIGNIFFGSILSVTNLKRMFLSGCGIVLSILFYIYINNNRTINDKK